MSQRTCQSSCTDFKAPSAAATPVTTRAIAAASTNDCKEVISISSLDETFHSRTSEPSHCSDPTHQLVAATVRGRTPLKTPSLRPRLRAGPPFWPFGMRHLLRFARLRLTPIWLAFSQAVLDRAHAAQVLASPCHRIRGPFVQRPCASSAWGLAFPSARARSPLDPCFGLRITFCTFPGNTYWPMYH